MLPELRDAELYQQLRKAFMAEHPDIDVQVEMLPWMGRMEKMTTALAGNRAPDAAYLNLDFMPKFVQLNKLLPVDNLLTSEEWEEYDPAVLDGVSQNGRIWLLPMLRTCTAALYNVDLLKKAGFDRPPETWDELEKMAAALTRPGSGSNAQQWGLGYVFGSDTLNLTFWPLLWQAGGEVLTPDGKHVAFGGPEGKRAMDFICGMYRKGYIPASFTKVRTEPR